MSLTRRDFVRAAGGSLVLASWPRRAFAHPDHASLSEAHHRPARRVIEFSTRVAPEDMRADLRAAHRDPGPLSGLEADRLGRLMAGRLRKAVRLRDREGLERPLMLVGHEFEGEGKWLWLHYLVACGPADDLSGFELAHTLFFDIAPTQTNTVLLHHGGRRESLVLTRDRPRAEISVPDPRLR